MDSLPASFLREHVEASLEEDLGAGDVTSDRVIAPDARARGRFRVKDEGVLVGIELVRAVFACLTARDGATEAVRTEWTVEDGDAVDSSEIVATAEGPARTLLTGERVALNYLQQLSGVATATRRLVRVADAHGVDVYDTRKTIPHHRRLQKYAVRCGGGRNHRMDLAEAAMIKDNHKQIGGGLVPCLRALEDAVVPIVVEIHHADELGELGGFDIDLIMLDNMPPDRIPDLLARVPDNIPVEVSGGITLSNLPRYCETGVDRVSAGALTHSSPSLDISFELI